MELPWSQAWIALAACLALMALAHFVLAALGRRGHVDMLWALFILAQALFHAGLGAGWAPRRMAVVLAATLWACRLAWHLSRRLGRDGEDGRYLAMEAKAGARAGIFFFAFFQLQGLAAWIFALPFFVLVQDPTPVWRVADLLAAILWLSAFIGVLVADRQLDRWRGEPANRGRTCRAGLWAWSRHPNYFFESLLWFSYAIAALGTPFVWLNAGIALLMLFLVTKVSGIPYNEQQALRSRGDEYRAYQRTTSSFFPLPPRHVDRNPGS